MVFTPASHSIGAGEDRDAFINHEGAYWLNPVPHGTSLSQSMPTTTKKFDMIDPFGNPKRRDRPDLFGKSRYGDGASDNQNKFSYTDRANGTHGDSSKVSGKEYSGSQDGVEGGNGAKGTTAVATGTGKDTQENENAVDISSGMDGVRTGAEGAPVDEVKFNGTGDSNGFQIGSTKQPFSTEDLMRDKLPLNTANPERRLAHPGNHTERILPTGGSIYNGTLSHEWTAPRAVDHTYIRLAPVYESTTHYQLRTGRFYLENEAPPHEMTLPTKDSLPKREW